MAKLHQLRRMSIILAKLKDGRRLSPEALLDSVRRSMSLFDDRYADFSLRTLQRDIRTVDELFHITIKCDRSGCYYIADRDSMSDEYESLLLNFELLSSIDSDSPSEICSSRAQAAGFKCGYIRTSPCDKGLSSSRV